MCSAGACEYGGAGVVACCFGSGGDGVVDDGWVVAAGVWVVGADLVQVVSGVDGDFGGDVEFVHDGVGGCG
jgi:hypothetical protein